MTTDRGVFSSPKQTRHQLKISKAVGEVNDINCGTQPEAPSLSGPVLEVRSNFDLIPLS